MNALHPELKAALSNAPFPVEFVNRWGREFVRVPNLSEATRLAAFWGHACGENVWKNLETHFFPTTNAMLVRSDVR
jgi:hypothetical protein